jgi:hypothetical protein
MDGNEDVLALSRDVVIIQVVERSAHALGELDAGTKSQSTVLAEGPTSGVNRASLSGVNRVKSKEQNKTYLGGVVELELTVVRNVSGGPSRILHHSVGKGHGQDLALEDSSARVVKER